MQYPYDAGTIPSSANVCTGGKVQLYPIFKDTHSHKVLANERSKQMQQSLMYIATQCARQLLWLRYCE